MKKYAVWVACCTLFPALVLAQDIEGSKDHPLFNRMTGFNITEYSYEEFGSEEFVDENEKDVTVEGEKTYIYYESEEQVAPLKIIRNYTNAAKKIGGKAIEYTANRAFINIRKDGKEIWAEINAGDNYYYITIVEKATVKQEISANDILKDLNETGKAILYINFDSGKSTIKDESTPIVEQISELLVSNPDISLSIEGHTDDQGDKDFNLKLSESRAKAVVDALVAKGVKNTRISSKGLGEDQPIADNSTEEGRAKNRRVELIKK